MENGTQVQQKTLKRHRQDAGLTQIQLALMANTTYQTISRAERGMTISRVMAVRICRALEIHIEDVLGLQLVD